jgi:hypothetical protein
MISPVFQYVVKMATVAKTLPETRVRLSLKSESTSGR